MLLKLLKLLKMRACLVEFQSLNWPSEDEFGITNKVQSHAANVEVTIDFFHALLFT